jgi:predicted dehydrogenase
MDYLKTKIGFRIKKVLHYVRLYGVRRTLIKVRGQYHMRRKFDVLPKLPPCSPDAHVGLIGSGNFPYCNISFYLRKHFGNVIRGVMDIDINRAASLACAYRAGYYTDNSNDVISDKDIDLIYVASDHASHADYAIAAVRAGKAVHVEKPHAVDLDQLVRLCRAVKEHDGRLSIGFNRQESFFAKKAASYLNNESGPAMISCFVVGHYLQPGHWYLEKKEGGRVPGNMCHWTDIIYHLIPAESRYPITINPTSAAEPDSNVAVSYTFGDGTIATITFSAKGDIFEGIREHFIFHKGDAYMMLEDFQTLTVDIKEKRHKTSRFFRDQGHEAKLLRSYSMVRPQGPAFNGSPLSYIWETGELFLKTKEALEEDKKITIGPYSEDKLHPSQPNI